MIHVRADMGSCERAVMDFESQAVSAGVTKHFVTSFSKTCNNACNTIFYPCYTDLDP